MADAAGRRPERVFEAIFYGGRRCSPSLLTANGRRSGQRPTAGRPDAYVRKLRSHRTLPLPTMILSTLAPLLLLLPCVAADGVHRLKLKKLPPTSSDPALESAYLAEKYGSAQSQTRLMGSGGSGRKVRLGRPGQGDDELFWTQESLSKGGHGVPLSST